MIKLMPNIMQRSSIHQQPYLLVIFFLSLLPIFSATAHAEEPVEKKLPVCVYIASYAPGYSWQNGVERGLNQTLKGHCIIKTFFMNSKRVFDETALQKIGLQAVDFIEANSPNVVIVSDDNAVKYVLKAHYKDSNIPFVYCGVNSSGIPYGLPYKNTTGMIEKNPTENILTLLFSIQPSKTYIALLTTTGTSANRDIVEFNKVVKKLGIESSAYQVQTEEEWRKTYQQLQEDPKIDIILFSNRAALKNWNHNENIKWIKKHNHKISITTQDWMMPYVALGMNKIPDEQGLWAGQAAVAILNGTPPNQISVIPNQDFQLWINPAIAKPFKDHLPENVFSHSLIYDQKSFR